MKSRHIAVYLTSFGFVAALTCVNFAADQRGTPPPQSQGRGQGQAAKPTPPPQKQTPPQKPTTPPAGAQSASQHLAQQPKLAAKLQPLLPPGTDLQLASAGFKNLGQFVAAVHVSNNLTIPFDSLRTRLTGPDPISLGQAIKELRPSVDAAAEVRKAEAQAKKDQGIK